MAMYIGLDFYCLWYPYRLWIDGLYAIDRIYHADLASAQKIDHEIDGEVFCVFFVGVVGDESGDEYYMYLRGTFCYQSLIGILLARLSIGSSAIKKRLENLSISKVCGISMFAQKVNPYV